MPKLLKGLNVNMILTVLQYAIFIFGIYFMVIAAAGLFNKRCRRKHPPQMRFAVIVPAHNEEKVIGNLVRNLKELDYPDRLYDIYIVADNCSDNTAQVARSEGASVVWERFDPRRRGKGYVLQYALGRLGFTGGADTGYAAAVFFDADNLVAVNFLQVMNNRLLEGEKLIQGFVDSKNPNDSWVTSAFSLTFWMNNRFILLARYNLGLSACLAGTGMCVAREVLRELGWSTVTLTEDLEFSIQALLRGYRTAFAMEARIYDEKPVSFAASCRQRLRWARGQINVALIYAPRLIWKGISRGNAAQIEGGLRLLQLFVLASGGFLTLFALVQPELVVTNSPYYQLSGGIPIVGVLFTAVPYVLPFVTLILDRLPLKPFRYYPLYPIFCFSWIFIIFCAFFSWRNRQWMPTKHTRNLDHRQLPQHEPALIRPRCR